MLGFRVYYDEQTNCFYADETAGEVQCGTPEFENGTVHWMDTKAHAVESVDRNNFNLKNGTFSFKICKDCGKAFCQSADEVKWFEDRDLVPPKRCSSCIRIRKRNRNQ